MLLRKIFLIVLTTVFISINVSGAEKGTTDADMIAAESEAEVPQYRAYLLGDDKGNIYYAENKDEKVPMASVTKVMTLMLTYDAINEGKIKLTDKVVVDKTMAKMQGSRIWMKEGSKISVEDLIKATALHSANNAAYGLAKTVGGDIDTFVKMMNKKAKKLGFGDDIKYHTPTGLPPHMTGRGEDVGSALGIYKLSLATLKYPEYIEMASKKSERLAYLGGEKIYNRNKLIGEEGIYGIKTGHHDDWFNITVASDKKGVNTITVVLGAPTEEARNEKILEEIELFHSEYTLVEFLNKDIPVSEIDIENGAVKRIEVYPEIECREPAGKDSRVSFVLNKKNVIKAPVRAGEEVGEYKLYLDGRMIGEGKLVVREDVESM